MGAPPDFLDRVFDDPGALVRESPAVLTRHEYLRLACIGGFPEVVARHCARSRAIWFRSYLTTVTQREVLDIARVRHIELLPRMFRLLAALTAQELNATALARDLGIDDETVRSYLPLLETPAGRVVGVEVKAATTVRGEDFRHLTTLQDRIGDHFAAGVVFFTGQRPLPFGDRIIALPISLLWGGAEPPSTP